MGVESGSLVHASRALPAGQRSAGVGLAFAGVELADMQDGASFLALLNGLVPVEAVAATAQEALAPSADASQSPQGVPSPVDWGLPPPFMPAVTTTVSMMTGAAASADWPTGQGVGPVVGGDARQLGFTGSNVDIVGMLQAGEHHQIGNGVKSSGNSATSLSSAQQIAQLGPLGATLSHSSGALTRIVSTDPVAPPSDGESRAEQLTVDTILAVRNKPMPALTNPMANDFGGQGMYFPSPSRDTPMLPVGGETQYSAQEAIASSKPSPDGLGVSVVALSRRALDRLTRQADARGLSPETVGVRFADTWASLDINAARVQTEQHTDSSAAMAEMPRQREWAQPEGVKVGEPYQNLHSTAPSPELSAEFPAESGIVAEQFVAEKVSFWATKGLQNAEMTIGGLGLEPVEVSIRVQGHEAFVAFRTDELQTRTTLENASVHLRELLQREGLSLSGLSVGTSAGGGSGGQEGSRPSLSARHQVESEDQVKAVVRNASPRKGMVDHFV